MNIPRLPLLQLDFVINGKWFSWPYFILCRSTASSSDPGLAFNVTYFLQAPVKQQHQKKKIIPVQVILKEYPLSTGCS